jgi:hypothetical protein
LLASGVGTPEIMGVPGVNRIAVLRHEEGVRVDPVRLAALYAELGQAGAERLISAVMEEMAVLLAAIRTAGQGDRVAGIAAELAARAGQVGMISLGRVARDVGCCAGAGDTVALAATLGRLVRIGTRSLTEVWDLRDLSL